MRTILCLLLFVVTTLHAEPPASVLRIGEHLLVQGSIPTQIFAHQAEVHHFVSFLERLTGSVIPAEKTFQVYFVHFGNEEKEYPSFALFQQQWLAVHEPGETQPFIKQLHFTGMYYVGTTLMQVDPDLFKRQMFWLPSAAHATLSAYAYGPGPVQYALAEGAGYGYYVFAHELLHQLLAEQGIPLKQHHCLILERGYPSKILKYLLHAGMANSAFVAQWHTWLDPMEKRQCTIQMTDTQ